MARSGNRATVCALTALMFGAVACSPSSSTSSAAPTTLSPSRSESGLYAVDIGTGDATLFLGPLEGGPVFALTEFALASDADLVAFGAEDANGDPQISVINADGTDLHRLTHGQAASSPAWSPDGARVAFRGLAPDSTYEIYVVDVASGETSRITRELQDLSGAPSWSPDGEMILFQVGEPPVVRSIDIATGATTTIVKDAGIPDVSPDGSRLAFNTWSVAKVTLAGIDGSDRTIIRSGRDECCAKWSPDGERIAFQDLEGNVYLYELATGERRTVGSGNLVDWLDNQTLLVSV